GLVVGLEPEVLPRRFTPEPVGNYRHRLVRGLPPAVPVDPRKTLLDDVRSRSVRPPRPPPEDPIAALLRDRLDSQERLAQPGDDELAPSSALDRQRTARGKRRSPAAIARMVTIAIDPGHGGEDPGAIGRRGTQE